MGSQRLPAEARGLEQTFAVWRAAACLGAGLTLLPASCRVTGARLRQLLAFFLTSAVHRRADSLRLVRQAPTPRAILAGARIALRERRLERNEQSHPHRRADSPPIWTDCALREKPSPQARG